MPLAVLKKQIHFNKTSSVVWASSVVCMDSHHPGNNLHCFWCSFSDSWEPSSSLPASDGTPSAPSQLPLRVARRSVLIAKGMGKKERKALVLFGKLACWDSDKEFYFCFTHEKRAEESVKKWLTIFQEKIDNFFQLKALARSPKK